MSAREELVRTCVAVMGDQSAASHNRLVYLKVHIAVAVTIMAYLAFTWSMVVLLGSFVGSVRRKDFTCLTIITLIEATRLVILLLVPFVTS